VSTDVCLLSFILFIFVFLVTCARLVHIKLIHRIVMVSVVNFQNNTILIAVLSVLSSNRLEAVTAAEIQLTL